MEELDASEMELERAKATIAGFEKKEEAALQAVAAFAKYANQDEIVLPLPGGFPAKIKLPIPMSPSQWEYLLKALNVIKEGIVAEG